MRAAPARKFARMIRALAVLALAFALPLAASGPARAGDSSPAYADITWSDLLPEGEAQRIAELQQMQALEFGFDHFGTDQMPQLQTFNVVEELDGEVVRIGGYILPFDYSGSNRTVSRFLLVPYVGACIHVPPPPPNQLIYVEADDPIEVQGLWDPVFITGTMRTRREDTDLAGTAYTMELEAVTPYRP
jgi:uncharacterized protein